MCHLERNSLALRQVYTYKSECLNTFIDNKPCTFCTGRIYPITKAE